MPRHPSPGLEWPLPLSHPSVIPKEAPHETVCHRILWRRLRNLPSGARNLPACQKTLGVQGDGPTPTVPERAASCRPNPDRVPASLSHARAFAEPRIELPHVCRSIHHHREGQGAAKDARQVEPSAGSSADPTHHQPQKDGIQNREEADRVPLQKISHTHRVGCGRQHSCDSGVNTSHGQTRRPPRLN